MTGIENYRIAMARMQSQRLCQPTPAPIQATQLSQFYYINISASAYQFAPLLQNTNGTFNAQSLYDR